MRNKLPVIAILLIALAAGWSSLYGRSILADALAPVDKLVEDIEIQAVPVPLYPETPYITRVGELSYVTGWELTSKAGDFGGWSSLLVSEDQKEIITLSDKGSWLKTTFDLSAKKPFGDAPLMLFDPSVKGTDKEDYDAESLAHYKNGILIGLEQNHRILFTGAPGQKVEPAEFNAHVDLSGLSHNSGIEAMAVDAANNISLFAENGRAVDGTLPAWHITEDVVRHFRFNAPKSFSPTDAAALPGGGLVVLLRHYSAISGVAMKLVYISAEELANDKVQGREIAHLHGSASVDNMEGLDIVKLDDGSYRLFIISDDNFNFAQRTLFMVFDWVGPNA